METATKHGLWWEIVLDAVSLWSRRTLSMELMRRPAFQAVQSKGSAFVGTDKSMMSLISGKRVEDWNRGPWELVKWVK